MKLRFISVAVAMAVSASLAGAQAIPRESLLLPSTGSGETSGTAIFAVNVALGAVTSGAWSALAHRPFWPAFIRGAAGGGAVFAGKRLIAEQTPLGWWTGRELASLGASEVRNAGEGNKILQRVALPVGPFRVHVDRTSGFHVTPKVDLASAASFIVESSRSSTKFGWDESISSSGLVFTASRITGGVGTHFAGVLKVSNFIPEASYPPLQRKRAVLSHELVHATQYDFISIAWSGALEDAIASRVPAVKFIHRFVDFGLLTPVQIGLNRMLKPADRPWEKEAGALASGY